MEGIVMESVWVAVGFAVFVALVWRPAGKALSSMLDERSDKIRADLDEARKLREEALEELHQFQRLHREAAAEAKAMLKTAEATAERIRENAEKAAAESVKRREVQATAKIKAAETAMVNELRERAAKLAIATATEIITSKLDEKTSLELVDSAAAEIEKLN
ncbi:ATP synthase F0 subunit B [Alphaproteobacteria bacterium]|jgi:F-type H+-transporting ATPase subunit b|nr:ATP synthase F0 subunit B [Alphaproteobacteria bacterium]